MAIGVGGERSGAKERGWVACRSGCGGVGSEESCASRWVWRRRCPAGFFPRAGEERWGEK